MSYEENAQLELQEWKLAMRRSPTLLNRLSKKMQGRINRIIPEKVHAAVTGAIKATIRAVLFGAEKITRKPVEIRSLEATEERAQRIIQNYKTGAAAEGGAIGLGGFLLGVAELPVLMGIKLKLLFDLCALYGYDVSDYRERLYILHIFGIAFSSHEHRREVFLKMEGWTAKAHLLPEDIHGFDWRSFQIEYRDYIDLAKMAQLIPGIGAVVGFVVNYRLLKKLGDTAMYAYRMRWEEDGRLAMQLQIPPAKPPF